MSPLHAQQLLLEEWSAPRGWTALLLRHPLPVVADSLAPYCRAAEVLRGQVEAQVQGRAQEVLLLFERCRPEREIPMLQTGARQWKPEFGVGIWTHQPPPTTWTKEELMDTAPGALRPVIERVVRISREPWAQDNAWHMLLGSGAVLRLYTRQPDVFLNQATDLLRPAIQDVSLTSFPFYLPLVLPSALHILHPAYGHPLDDLLAGVDAYLCESVEEGGLFALVRQEPKRFWEGMRDESLPFATRRRALA